MNPPGRTRTLTAYIDGASRGNPGESGFGVLAVLAPDASAGEDESPDSSGAGVGTDREVELYGYLGRATNNRAEYCALLAALAYARAAGVQVLLVRSDSELMVKQIKGLYRVQNEHLKPLHAEAVKQAARFERFEISHIPRKENKRADRLANIAVNLKKNSFPGILPFEKLPFVP